MLSVEISHRCPEQCARAIAGDQYCLEHNGERIAAIKTGVKLVIRCKHRTHFIRHEKTTPFGRAGTGELLPGAQRVVREQVHARSPRSELLQRLLHPFDNKHVRLIFKQLLAERRQVAFVCKVRPGIDA